MQLFILYTFLCAIMPCTIIYNQSCIIIPDQALCLHVNELFSLKLQNISFENYQ